MSAAVVHSQVARWEKRNGKDGTGMSTRELKCEVGIQGGDDEGRVAMTGQLSRTGKEK